MRKLFLALTMVLCAAAAHAQTFGTTDFRRVKNLTTGAVSQQMCGREPIPGDPTHVRTGVFFNSGDQGGGSCINPNAGFTVIGDKVWAAFSNPSSFYTTRCYSEFWTCFTGTTHAPWPRNTCDLAMEWHAFKVADLSYAGEALTMGGALMQPVDKDYVCPVAAPTVTPTPSAAPSSTPTASAITPISPVPTVTPGPSPCLRLPCDPPPPSPSPTIPAPADTPPPTVTVVHHPPPETPVPAPTSTATASPRPSATATPTAPPPPPTATAVAPQPSPSPTPAPPTSTPAKVGGILLLVAAIGTALKKLWTWIKGKL